MPESKTTKGTEATPKSKGKYTDKEIKEGKSIAWLSYFGLLALIPYFSQKDNKYTHAHAIIGLNLLIVEAAWGVLMSILTSLIRVPVETWLGTFYTTPVWLSLISLAGYIFIAVISIMGIVNACSGKVKDLPLVGQVKIIKK